ncbi:MAG: hypothetical protein MJ135_07770 [Oscillospiraceae bacterium]|nr:hypothetical protein [Oscillospiraceae bacterium]
MQISDYFINGDIKGAIAYMRCHEEFSDVLPAYTAIFEDEEYRKYDISERLNRILLAYQVYYRDIFYCGLPHSDAAQKLFSALRVELNRPDADENQLAEQLQTIFEEEGYHAQFGKTQGYYGPYIWRDTVPTVYQVELPCSVAEYTVNILKGFVFRSWMDYLTFGQFGTGGWASPDGVINCIEQAYDFESDRFLVSLLKHEAQHTEDMKQYPGITPTELEYRAKLVELCYSHDEGLLQRFIEAANESRTDDSHAMASARIKNDFVGFTTAPMEEIRAKALELFLAHNLEMSQNSN